MRGVENNFDGAVAGLFLRYDKDSAERNVRRGVYEAGALGCSGEQWLRDADRGPTHATIYS